MARADRLLRVALVALAGLQPGCTDLLGDFAVGYAAQPNTGDAGTPAIQGDIVLTPSAGLVTNEQGGKAMLTIALRRKPNANVAVALSSSNPAEGTVAPGSVTFTPDNYNAPQTIVATGVNDDRVDGNQTYLIVTSSASSSDPTYAGMDAIDPTVINVDDETAGFTVTPSTGLVTSESGSEATFTVVLNSPPTDGVAIGVSSTNEAEGLVTPGGLEFTPDNWNAPQEVRVVGVDDDIADGPQVYAVVTAAASSADPRYHTLDPDDVQVENQDNDSAGITLAPETGLVTSESGEMAMFSVALNSPPTADVVIELRSSNENEGTLSPSNLTFTPANWMAPQIVTLTGIDDDVADGNQLYEVITMPAVSEDAGYSGLDAANAQASNIDDDSPGLGVTPTAELVTSEAGASATFSVVLSSRPSGEVLLDLSSSAPDEGTVTPALVAFTAANWKAPQTITIVGVDDAIADGNQPYLIHIAPNAASTDAAYAALLPVDASASNTDDDSAGVTVTGQGLTTSELGMTATFTVVLNSQPTENVRFQLTSSDGSEGTPSPSSLTFTPNNYDAPQTITVKGVNDDIADGNQVYKVTISPAVSDDPNYQGLSPGSVDVTNVDDDSPGVTVTPTSGLVTTEAGGNASFTVVLNSEPKSKVTIGLSSTNPAEGVATPSSVEFTKANWNAPRTITLTGQDDSVADGAQTYRITVGPASSTDAGYNGIDPFDVTVTNTDNDSAGVTINAGTSQTTTEAGATSTFTIVLNSKPTANVTIPLSTSDPSEGTVSPASVTFTPANWNAAQTVTATGVDDKVADGNQPYVVVTQACSSNDSRYGGINPSDVTVTNIDDDSAGITVAPISGLGTSEAGGTASFTVVLNSKPTANVTVSVHVSKPREATLSASAVAFTPVNWNSPQTVTIKGQDDDIADGTQPFFVITDAASSMDAKYAGLDPPDVSCSNVDNDSAGITVSLAAGSTSEAGGTTTFTVVLNSRPTANVTIPLQSSDTGEGIVATSSVTFTEDNWSAKQTVVVTGVNDSVADGTQSYSIVTGAGVSADIGYEGMNPADVAISNVDNDSAGITVSDALGSTTEAGTTTTFSIVLNSQPTSSVTIPLASSDTSEGMLAVSSITFSTSNWSSAQNITVTGVNDNVADGAQPYTIVVGAATSSDGAYAGMDATDVALVNVDNDSAGITVSDTAGATTESGGGTTFSIVLNSQPTASVTLDLASSDPGEGTVSPSSLTFTTSNWSAPQSVTVHGIDDAIADGDQEYRIAVAKAKSADPTYAAIDPRDVTLVNVDNDSAGITVSAAAGSTSEAGGSTTFSVVLNSQPTASVSIAFSSSDGSEGTPLVNSITFAPADWDTPRVVSVVGEDDNVADGPQEYKIVTAPATSNDPGYDGKNGADVTVTNLDDDSAFIVVTQPLVPLTSEALDSAPATFSVVLTSKPSASVTIALESSKPSEGVVVDPVLATLVFSENDWSTPQTVSVKGVQDLLPDGDQPYTIKVMPAQSADPGYNGFDPDDVDLTNLDDDLLGL